MGRRKERKKETNKQTKSEEKENSLKYIKKSAKELKAQKIQHCISYTHLLSKYLYHLMMTSIGHNML
jgi:hypothetical protein